MLWLLLPLSHHRNSIMMKQKIKEDQGCICICIGLICLLLFNIERSTGVPWSGPSDNHLNNLSYKEKQASMLLQKILEILVHFSSTPDQTSQYLPAKKVFGGMARRRANFHIEYSERERKGPDSPNPASWFKVKKTHGSQQRLRKKKVKAPRRNSLWKG